MHPFASRPGFESLDARWFAFGDGADLPRKAVGALQQLARQEAGAGRHGGPIWGAFDAQCSNERAALTSGDPALANPTVRRMFGTHLTTGFLQGAEGYERMSSHESWRYPVATMILDRFYRLAEAVGATRVLSLEHGQTAISVGDLDGVLSRVENEIGADLPAPEQDGCLFGLRLRGGLYTERHFDSIYAAWRAREVARDHGIASPAMCEIGGGAGHTAYYARKMGCRSYAIVDLPQARIAQYVVLATAFGVNRVSLGGEMRDGIELIGAGTPAASDMARWDVVINVDSFPEMPPEAAVAYIRNLRSGQILLSINQESGVPNGEHRQNVVRDIAEAQGLKRLSRHPAWLRTGYVEEVFVRRS